MYFLDGHDKSSGRPFGAVQHGGDIACAGVLLGFAHAGGYQTYVAEVKDGALAWQHKGPAADLTFDDGTTGIHGSIDEGDPYWTYDAEGFQVSAHKQGARKEAHPPEGQVPALCLDAYDGTGRFAHVRYIQRVECSGGRPVGPPVLEGESKSIPYSARYLFVGDEHHVANYDDA